MDKTLTLPEKFVARVDLDRFWEEYLRGPVTAPVLVEAKRQLLDAGVPESMVYAYLCNLARTLSGEASEMGGVLERLMYWPGEMGDQEAQILQKWEARHSYSPATGS